MHTRGISFDGAVYPEVCFLVLQRMFIVHGHCGWHLVPKVCGLFTVQVGPAMDEQVCVRVSIVGPVCLVSVWVVLNCSSHSSLPFTAPNCLSPMTNPQTEDSSRQWTRTFRRQWRWMDLPRKKTWGNSLFLSAIIYLIPPPPPLISQETQEGKTWSVQLTWPWEEWAWTRTSSQTSSCWGGHTSPYSLRCIDS